MTDYSVNIPRGQAPRTGSTEYRVYFALILLAALPFGLIGWLAAPLVRDSRRTGGPLRRAVAEARLMTPMIFRA